jgi:hypothetical protein
MSLASAWTISDMATAGAEDSAMNPVTVMKVMRHAVCAVFQARLRLAQARLQMLLARTRMGAAKLELRTVTRLVAKARALERATDKLTAASAQSWDRTKSGLEKRVAAFEAAVHAAESRFRST